MLVPEDPEYKAKAAAVDTLHKLMRLRATDWSTAAEVEVPGKAEADLCCVPSLQRARPIISLIVIAFGRAKAPNTRISRARKQDKEVTIFFRFKLSNQPCTHNSKTRR